ncbi:MAG: hypothetical protein ACK5Z2_00330 [Bacteroidota bacterium]|jgi:hypothetical protein
MKLSLYYSIIPLVFFFSGEGLSTEKSVKRVTLYISYKPIKNNIFYIYNNDTIVYKSKSDKNTPIYDSLAVNSATFNDDDIYLPFTAVSRKGKEISSLKFHIQNIPGYNYIYIDHIEAIRSQYYFRIYYFKSPISQPYRFGNNFKIK